MDYKSKTNKNKNENKQTTNIPNIVNKTYNSKIKIKMIVWKKAQVDFKI